MQSLFVVLSRKHDEFQASTSKICKCECLIRLWFYIILQSEFLLHFPESTIFNRKNDRRQAWIIKTARIFMHTSESWWILFLTCCLITWIGVIPLLHFDIFTSQKRYLRWRIFTFSNCALLLYTLMQDHLYCWRLRVFSKILWTLHTHATKLRPKRPKVHRFKFQVSCMYKLLF